MRRAGAVRSLVGMALALGLTVDVQASGRADRTREYLDLYARECAFGAAQVAALRRVRVLLVPGYFGHLIPRYFVDQLRWLKSIGVEHEKLAVNSVQGVAVNAPIVAAAIRDSAKPVVLITHSKGSVDTLEALRVEPALRKKVVGWVSLQGAFFGSPVADMLLDDRVLDPAVVTTLLGIFDASREAAEGLTTVASAAYYRDHEGAIKQLTDEVPAIAFASAIDGSPGIRANTLLWLPHDLMRREGIRSDGLVPVDSAVLPGMAFVEVTGIDHVAPVMPTLQRFDRVRMTKALLLTMRGPIRDLKRDPACAIEKPQTKETR